MGCDEALFACSPTNHRGYSNFALQISDSQTLTTPSSTSLIIQQQNQTLTELIRDILQGAAIHKHPHEEALNTSASYRVFLITLLKMVKASILQKQILTP